MQPREYGHVEYTLMAISKGWIDLPERTYPALLNALIESFKKDYCDLSNSSPEYAARVFVERWFACNEHYKVFNIFDLLQKNEPAHRWYYGYPQKIEDRKVGMWDADPNYDAGHFGNWLRAFACEVAVIHRTQDGKLREWLIANGYAKENAEGKLEKIHAHA